MFSLKDIYGSNYEQKDNMSAINMTLNTISNNIAHRNYDFLVDTNKLWDSSNHLNNNLINELYNKISKVNNKLTIIHLLDRKLIPTCVDAKTVEYFLVIDKIYQTAFIIYITREKVGIL